MGQIESVFDSIANTKIVSAVCESRKAKIHVNKRQTILDTRTRSTSLPLPKKNKELEMSRSRQDYLRRLGIQKDKNAFWQIADDYVEEESSINGSPNEKIKITNKETELNVFDIINQNDFRINFLRKLSYENVWVPKAQKSPKHQTVIIFDWDDTLLCTSFLTRHELPLSDFVQRILREIETTVKRLLMLAMRLGHTFIITNADDGWVEHSAAQVAPTLLPVLQKIHIISARTKYEPEFPGERNKWKIQTFLDVQKKLDSQIIANLISLGDSNYEMEAVQVMGEEFTQAFIKTVKFVESPSPEELLKQLQLVSLEFEQIVETPYNWAIHTLRES